MAGEALASRVSTLPLILVGPTCLLRPTCLQEVTSSGPPIRGVKSAQGEVLTPEGLKDLPNSLSPSLSHHIRTHAPPPLGRPGTPSILARCACCLLPPCACTPTAQREIMSTRRGPGPSGQRRR